MATFLSPGSPVRKGVQFSSTVTVRTPRASFDPDLEPPDAEYVVEEIEEEVEEDEEEEENQEGEHSNEPPPLTAQRSGTAVKDLPPPESAVDLRKALSSGLPPIDEEDTAAPAASTAQPQPKASPATAALKPRFIEQKLADELSTPPPHHVATPGGPKAVATPSILVGSSNPAASDAKAGASPLTPNGPTPLHTPMSDGLQPSGHLKSSGDMELNPAHSGGEYKTPPSADLNAEHQRTSRDSSQSDFSEEGDLAKKVPQSRLIEEWAVGVVLPDSATLPKLASDLAAAKAAAGGAQTQPPTVGGAGSQPPTQSQSQPQHQPQIAIEPASPLKPAAAPDSGARSKQPLASAMKATTRPQPDGTVRSTPPAEPNRPPLSGATPATGSAAAPVPEVTGLSPLPKAADSGRRNSGSQPAGTPRQGSDVAGSTASSYEYEFFFTEPATGAVLVCPPIEPEEVDQYIVRTPPPSVKQSALSPNGSTNAVESSFSLPGDDHLSVSARYGRSSFALASSPGSPLSVLNRGSIVGRSARTQGSSPPESAKSTPNVVPGPPPVIAPPKVETPAPAEKVAVPKKTSPILTPLESTTQPTPKVPAQVVSEPPDARAPTPPPRAVAAPTSASAQLPSDSALATEAMNEESEPEELEQPVVVAPKTTRSIIDELRETMQKSRAALRGPVPQSQPTPLPAPKSDRIAAKRKAVPVNTRPPTDQKAKTLFAPVVTVEPTDDSFLEVGGESDAEATNGIGDQASFARQSTSFSTSRSPRKATVSVTAPESSEVTPAAKHLGSDISGTFAGRSSSSFDKSATPPVSRRSSVSSESSTPRPSTMDHPDPDSEAKPCMALIVGTEDTFEDQVLQDVLMAWEARARLRVAVDYEVELEFIETLKDHALVVIREYKACQAIAFADIARNQCLFAEHRARARIEAVEERTWRRMESLQMQEENEIFDNSGQRKNDRSLLLLNANEALARDTLDRRLQVDHQEFLDTLTKVFLHLVEMEVIYPMHADNATSTYWGNRQKYLLFKLGERAVNEQRIRREIYLAEQRERRRLVLRDDWISLRILKYVPSLAEKKHFASLTATFLLPKFVVSKLKPLRTRPPTCLRAASAKEVQKPQLKLLMYRFFGDYADPPGMMEFLRKEFCHYILSCRMERCFIASRNSFDTCNKWKWDADKVHEQRAFVGVKASGVPTSPTSKSLSKPSDDHSSNTNSKSTRSGSPHQNTRQSSNSNTNNTPVGMTRSASHRVDSRRLLSKRSQHGVLGAEQSIIDSRDLRFSLLFNRRAKIAYVASVEIPHVRSKKVLFRVSMGYASRRKLGREHFDNLRRTGAALLIQGAYRRFQLRKQERKRLQPRAMRRRENFDGAIAHSALLRKEYRDREQRYNADCSIERYIFQTLAARLVQAFCYPHRAIKIIRQRVEEPAVRAFKILSKWLRATRQRIRLKRYRADKAERYRFTEKTEYENYYATLVQSCWRRYAARTTVFRELKIEAEYRHSRDTNNELRQWSATVLQGHYRRSKAQLDLRRSRAMTRREVEISEGIQLKNYSATLIQTRFRIFRDRKQLEQLLQAELQRLTNRLRFFGAVQERQQKIDQEGLLHKESFSRLAGFTEKELLEYSFEDDPDMTKYPPDFYRMLEANRRAGKATAPPKKGAKEPVKAQSYQEKPAGPNQLEQLSALKKQLEGKPMSPSQQPLAPLVYLGTPDSTALLSTPASGLPRGQSSGSLAGTGRQTSDQGGLLPTPHSVRLMDPVMGSLGDQEVGNVVVENTEATPHGGQATPATQGLWQRTLNQKVLPAVTFVTPSPARTVMAEPNSLDSTAMDNVGRPVGRADVQQRPASLALEALRELNELSAVEESDVVKGNRLATSAGHSSTASKPRSLSPSGQSPKSGNAALAFRQRHEKFITSPKPHPLLRKQKPSRAQQLRQQQQREAGFNLSGPYSNSRSASGSGSAMGARSIATPGAVRIDPSQYRSANVDHPRGETPTPTTSTSQPHSVLQTSARPASASLVRQRPASATSRPAVGSHRPRVDSKVMGLLQEGIQEVMSERMNTHYYHSLKHEATTSYDKPRTSLRQHLSPGA